MKLELQEKRWHEDAKPCSGFTSHPHMVDYEVRDMHGNFLRIEHGGCYQCRVSSVCESDGSNELALALQDAGIECNIEQTGGFCMVVYVYSADKKKALTMTTDAIGFEPDVEEGMEEWVDLTPYEAQGEAIPLLVELTKQNLWRIGK